VTDMARDPEEDVELGELVEAAPEPVGRVSSAMVALRLSAELLGRATAYGRQHGLTLSEVFRRAVDQLTDTSSATRATFVMSGTVAFGPSLVHGAPAIATGRTLEATVPGTDLAFTRVP
jgi:hypothetical protein